MKLLSNLTLNKIERIDFKLASVVRYEKLLKNDLKGYKGVLIPKIVEALLEDGIEVLEGDIDVVLKAECFETTEISCKDMTLEQIRNLKEVGKRLLMRIGVDDDEGNGIEFNW